ncbi:group-specific protein [Jeotgalibacillus sp. S-D1]|uniref:group-specific protein n=1 Tax=Jeotgalibacillus sp. S-D1 TaxID=2552189 RepID=UPI0010596378|nr:group-specific protein [Jeotgalibacillus sp. S-D1]TDL31904.1 group-specific protein [Jeotgalibacillus sp. S-D1]
MGTCSIDHSHQEVVNKLDSQLDFLPSHLYEGAQQFLKTGLRQEELNELFHLLKKYDLVSMEERQMRNKQMEQLIKK